MAKVQMDEDPVVKAMQDKYPGNSIKSKTIPFNTEAKATIVDEERPEKVEAVVKGEVVVKKPGLFSGVKEKFIKADAKDVGSYFVNQLLIPASKNMLMSVIQMALFGQASRGPWIGGNMPGYNPNTTNYHYISQNQQSNLRVNNVQQNQPQQSRVRNRFDDIVFPDYQSAEDVVSSMLDQLQRYGEVSVSVFYQLCNLPYNWTDQEWGWRVFQKIEPRPIRGGYVIDIYPAPMYIKR